jgi:hypothetical protein
VETEDAMGGYRGTVVKPPRSMSASKCAAGRFGSIPSTMSAIPYSSILLGSGAHLRGGPDVVGRRLRLSCFFIKWGARFRGLFATPQLLRRCGPPLPEAARQRWANLLFVAAAMDQQGDG